MSPTINKIAVGVLLALGGIDVGILNMVLVPAVLEEENQGLVADTIHLGVEGTFETPSEPTAMSEVVPSDEVVDGTMSDTAVVATDFRNDETTSNGQEETIEHPASDSVASLEKVEQHILFAMGSGRLTEGAVKQLVPIARRARKLKLALHLSGHTDASGEPSFNTLLSRRRVQVVRDKFRQLGISKRNLRIEYFGDRRPIPDREDTMQRRVEIRLWRSEQ